MSLLWCARPQSRVGHSPSSLRNRPTSKRETMSSLDENLSLVQFHADTSHYQLHTVIGRGSNPAITVWLAKHIPSGQLVAVKRVNLEEFNWDFSQLQHGVLMQRLVGHPHILPSLASFVHMNDVWSVLPLMAYGSCQDLIQAHFAEGLPETAIAYILRDVLDALDYFHHRGIIHRSIRASHVLIAASGHVCLSGLRDSYNMLSDGQRQGCVHDLPKNYVRSLLWASPEMLSQNLAGYDTKTDIYSVGILACELGNGVVPFADMPPTQMLLEKLDGRTPQLLDKTTVPELRQLEEQTTPGDSGLGGSTGTPANREGTITPPYQRVFSEQFHNFVQCCFEADPQKRPSASALMQHSFLRQIKRRSAVESLPELLQPVSPLTSIIDDIPTEDAGVSNLAEKMEAVKMEGSTEWTF